MKKLIKAQKEYITFLEKHTSSMGMFMAVHGQAPSKEDLDKGIELRAEIKKHDNTKNQC